MFAVSYKNMQKLAQTKQFGEFKFKQCKYLLKAVDTIGNCQRPVFSLGVSQHMHKITNL